LAGAARMKRPLAALTLLVLTAGCRAERDEAPLETIIIAAALIPHASLVHLAAAEGYFAREGLAVTLQPHDIGKQALNAVITGKADLGTCAEGPLVFAALHGERIAVLATIANSTKATAVLAWRGSGIATAKDLAGKRVGLLRGTSAEFFLDTLLVRNEVDRDAVRIVETRQDEMRGALERGEMDAVATWIPGLATLQEQLGDKVLSFHAEDVYSETFNLASRTEFAQQRPEAVKKVLRALLRAEALFRDEPEKARRVEAKALEGDPTQVGAMLGLFDFRVRLDQSLVVLMEEEARWAIHAGLVPKQEMPNVLAAIAPEPLLAVRSGAVGLIR
jgi:NitT/TauT family transport system substrate-binding protein